MLSLESALYVRLQDTVSGRASHPWGRAFRHDRAYRVLDVLHSDLGSPSYALLHSGQHRRYVPVWALRVVACAPLHVDYELPIDGLLRQAASNALPLEEGHWPNALSQPQALRTGNTRWEDGYNDVLESEPYVAPWVCKI